jgi:hypothetical protein
LNEINQMYITIMILQHLLKIFIGDDSKWKIKQNSK